MFFLTILTYIALCVQILFATVAIASGLYYLAEIVEEYSTQAKKCIWWMNITVLTLYILLWIFEHFPAIMIISGLTEQVLHFLQLKNFPFVSFTSPVFIATVIFVLINHYLAFSHFTDIYYSLFEVLSYFTIFLWLVPFALFVSLTANDYVLPTMRDKTDNDMVSNYLLRKVKKYGLRSWLDNVKENLLPMRTRKEF